MLQNFLLVLALLVVVVFILAVLKPATFQVERSAEIKAPAEKLYALINDFSQWQAWSPWEKLDPAMQRRFSGARSGVGAVYEWEGNSKAGQGRMEITESVPSSRVALQLEFIKPFPGKHAVTFTLTPNGERTSVSWAMAGPRPFPMRIFGVFFNIDKMIGKDYATGLANLKRVTE